VGFPGGVQVRGEYLSFGRPASMVFHAKFERVPTADDCQSLTRAYGLWESLGGLIPTGYSTLRSNDSHFVGCRAFSVDPAGGGSFTDGPFSRDGFITEHLGRHLPTTMAPLVYWEHTPEKPQPGRTYCTGLTDVMISFTADSAVIDDLNADALLSIMNNLRAAFLEANGAVQVGVERMRGGVLIEPWGAYPVSGCHVGDRLMGAQRRRTRPESYRT
jgi:hypothetical protein